MILPVDTSWGSVLSKLVALAAVIALSPITVIPAVLVLHAPRPRPASLSFLGGWLLGGGLGLDSGFGRKLRGHKVTSAELADYVERLVLGYAQQREPGERFAQWVNRAEESALR